eukprot:UN05039
MKENIFIDRDPKHFRTILNYLRTKQLVIDDLNIHALKELKVEGEYYKLSDMIKLIDKRLFFLKAPDVVTATTEECGMFVEFHKKDIHGDLIYEGVGCASSFLKQQKHKNEMKYR